jgi:hypothetical protein
MRINLFPRYSNGSRLISNGCAQPITNPESTKKYSTPRCPGKSEARKLAVEAGKTSKSVKR